MPVTKTARDGVNTQFSDGSQARNVIVVDESNAVVSPLTAADFDARIGEVQATPTANTVLDRLKAILTGVVLATGANIIGRVGIDQTTPGTTNRVDVGAALPAGTNLLGKVGVDQTTPGTTDRVTAGGNMVTVGVEVARTGGGDVTPYTAKDVFDTAAGAGFVFAGMARVVGGSGIIVKAMLATDQKTNTARWRLHLFNAAPTYIADNAPYLTLYANIGARIGTIDFDACTTEDPTNSTQATSQKVGNLLPFVCAADATLYGILELLDGFTPASAQKITVKLTAMRN